MKNGVKYSQYVSETSSKLIIMMTLTSPRQIFDVLRMAFTSTLSFNVLWKWTSFTCKLILWYFYIESKILRIFRKKHNKGCRKKILQMFGSSQIYYIFSQSKRLQLILKRMKKKRNLAIGLVLRSVHAFSTLFFCDYFIGGLNKFCFWRTIDLQHVSSTKHLFWLKNIVYPTLFRRWTRTSNMR